MRRLLWLGTVALLAGIIFGTATIVFPPSPALTAPIHLPPTAVAAAQPPIAAAAFLVPVVPTVKPTDTAEPSPTAPATATAVPPTSTMVPATPTVMPVPTKTGASPAPEVN